MKNRNQIYVAGAIFGVVVLCGCNIGMQPTGASVEEINAIRAKWPPEQQIAGIRQSPMPAAEKKRRIAEIRAKYHMPAEDASAEPAPTNSRPGGSRGQ
jgi:hypothetical protein